MLDCYPADKVVLVESTLSQIRVLSEVVKVLVPLKEQIDVDRELSKL